MTPAHARARKTALWIALAAIIGALTTVTGGVGTGPAPAGAQAAPVVTGLVKVSTPVNAGNTNSVSPKTAVAECPGTKRVVGGGGWAYQPSAGSFPERLALTELRPNTNVDGEGADGYIASAAETSSGTTGSWWVQAYALCADANSLSGWRLVSSYWGGSATLKRLTPGCNNSAQRVLGSGAAISGATPGDVVLQTTRVSGPGDIIRAQAQDADGNSGNWSLDAYAICADTPPGYAVVTGESPQRASEATKRAVTGCAGKQMLSSGAAITDAAPGNVSLQQVYPASVSPGRMEAFAVENTPTSRNWDFIIARGVCVSR